MSSVIFSANQTMITMVDSHIAGVYDGYYVNIRQILRNGIHAYAQVAAGCVFHKAVNSGYKGCGFLQVLVKGLVAGINICKGATHTHQYRGDNNQNQLAPLNFMSYIG